MTRNSDTLLKRMKKKRMNNYLNGKERKFEETGRHIFINQFIETYFWFDNF